MPDGADVIATFADGGPAITSARYGKGRAFLIGSYVGFPHYRTGYPATADLIAGLIDSAVEIPRPRVDRPGSIRVDSLWVADGEQMVIVRNLEGTPVESVLVVPGLHPGEMVEQFSGERIQWKAEEKGPRVSLQAGEVKVYRGLVEGVELLCQRM